MGQTVLALFKYRVQDIRYIKIKCAVFKSVALFYNVFSNNFLVAFCRRNNNNNDLVCFCGVQLNLIPSIGALIVCIRGSVVIVEPINFPCSISNPAGYVQPFLSSR